MSSITVVYDSIQKSIPVIEGLSDDCSTLSKDVSDISSELDSIGANHDSCFANSISAVEILSTFITKMGAEYDAIASFANTTIDTFKESEGKIIADSAKIEDMKTMLSYLGMSEASVAALDFDKINGYKTMDDYKKADDKDKADISLYEKYYKDTNADLGEVTESAILDMMVTTDGDGKYRTVTTEEMKKYIEERAKAQAASEAESTVTGPGSTSSYSNTAATTSSSVRSNKSESTKDTKEKTKETEKKEKTKEEEKKEEPKQEEKKEEETKEEEPKEEEKKEEPKEEEKQEEPKEEEKKEEPKQEEKKEETVIVKQVEASKPATTMHEATQSAQTASNANNQPAETPVKKEEKVEEPLPTEEVPEEEPTIEDDPVIDDPVQNDPSSRTTVPLPTEDTSKSSSSSKVIPAIAGIATAAAAGIGTKIYLDKKANSDDDYNEEESEEYYDEYEDNSNNEVSEGSLIQSPDSTWDSGQEENDLRY